MGRGITVVFLNIQLYVNMKDYLHAPAALTRSKELHNTKGWLLTTHWPIDKTPRPPRIKQRFSDNPSSLFTIPSEWRNVCRAPWIFNIDNGRTRVVSFTRKKKKLISSGYLTGWAPQKV
jgi:hypothetical protein